MALRGGERVTAVQTMHFPTEAQWAAADLVVFFSGLDIAWEKSHYDLVDAYQARGGGGQHHLTPE